MCISSRDKYVHVIWFVDVGEVRVEVDFETGVTTFVTRHRACGEGGLGNVEAFVASCIGFGAGVCWVFVLFVWAIVCQSIFRQTLAQTIRSVDLFFFLFSGFGKTSEIRFDAGRVLGKLLGQFGVELFTFVDPLHF